CPSAHPSLLSFPTRRSSDLIDSGHYLEMIVQDRRGLHIIPDHSLFQHVQDILRKLCISAVSQRPHYVQACNAPFHHIVRSHQVRRRITIQGIFASVGVNNSFHLLVGHRSKSQILKYSLHGFCRRTAHPYHILLGNRAETAVYLHISLHNVIVVKVLRVEIGTGEHVVIIGFCSVTGEDEICSRHELQHGPCGSSHIGVREALVVGGSPLQTQKRCHQVLSHNLTDSGRNAGSHTDTAYGTVLDSLASGAFRHIQAAALQIKHGFFLTASHESL